MKTHAKVVLAAVAVLFVTTETQAQWSSSGGFSEQAPWTDQNIQEEREYRPGFQNGNAGYPGSEYPEYHPDRRTREYQQEKTAPLPPLDNGMYSAKPNPYCTNAPLCGGPSGQ